MRLPDPSLWDLYNSRGLNGGMFFRDLDTSKAILIYSSSYLEAGETFMRFGRFPEGERMLRIAATLSPEFRAQVDQLLKGYGVR